MNKRRLTIRITAASLAFVLGVAAASLLLTLPSSPLPEVKGPDVRTEAPAPAAVLVAAEPAAETVEEEETGPPVSHARLPEGHLLEVGEFHGDEVKARTGERWLGLFVTKGWESSLSHATLKVKRVADPIVDEMTGKRVSVKRRPDPVFLIKGATTLRPGPVLTVFHENESDVLSLGHGADVELKLGAEVYHLKVPGRGRGVESAISRDDAKLILAAGGTEQVLYDLGGKGRPTEAWWRLVWAGDADGDGKLDLYVYVAWHYNVTQYKLFLSSQAEGSELVREEADLTFFGC